MPRPPTWQRTLDGSKRQAMLAVKLYNDPSDPMALEGFVIHLHLAWLYLKQAQYQKEKKEFRVRDRSYRGIRYERTDGEYRTQALSWFMQQDYADHDPVRANVEFFIKLRNKLEHRHEDAMKPLADAIAGESHSYLLNYEEALVMVGGEPNSLAGELRFPVFLGGFTDRGKLELLKQSKALPDEYKVFIADYYSTLGDDVLTDSRFSLRLTVVLEKANRSGDWSMSFVNPNDLDETARQELEDRLRHGALITREKQVSVANLALLKPKKAQEAVQSGIPFIFNSHHFQKACKIAAVKPPAGDPPESTRADFCIYDEPNHAYLYTQEWVEYLVRKCGDPDGFKTTTGRAAIAV
jgi:hypothetical protein